MANSLFYKTVTPLLLSVLKTLMGAKEFDEFRLVGGTGLIKAFETNKSNVFWDGRTTGGSESVDGTYFYIISTEEKIYKGFLQLIR